MVESEEDRTILYKKAIRCKAEHKLQTILYQVGKLQNCWASAPCNFVMAENENNTNTI